MTTLRRTNELVLAMSAWFWPPRLTGSEWADANRVLPSADAEPGLYRTDRFPPIREIQDTLSDETTRKVVLWGPTQSAKTTAIANFVGRVIEHDPGRTLIVYPTEDKATEFSTEKLEPMLEACPSLKAKADVGTARTHRKSVLTKTFPGMVLMLRGGNSANPFSSGSIRNVILDELDRIPPNKEGNPIDLAAQRVTTFHNHKLILASTCTDMGASPIEAEYEKSDQRKPYVPCLACGHMHVMEFEQIDFDGEHDPDKARKLARYRCPECKHEHYDRDKPAMLARVEWRKGNPDSVIAGFWWNALYSPWVSFGQLAYEFRSSYGTGDMDAFKVFWNCRLARTWEVKGDKPTDEVLAACIDHEKARGHIPPNTLALTAGVDVQKTHVYYVIRAWGPMWRSSLVTEGILPRTEGGSLDFLDDVLLGDYGGFHVAAAFVDSGNFTDTVYTYCMRHPGRVYPTKGWERRSLPVEFADLEKMASGRRIPFAMKLVHCDASHWKAFVHDHIRVNATDPGEWRLHGEVSADYLDQILGEKRERRIVGAREQWKWVPVKGKANHFLDAEGLAAACAWMPVAVHRIQSAVGKVNTAPPQPQRDPQDNPPSWIKGGSTQRRGGWLRG